LFKISYFGFNEDDIEKPLEKINGIIKAVCGAVGCHKDDLIIAVQPTYNGKRHVEILPLSGPTLAGEKAARAIFDEGFNVILLPQTSLVLWRRELEKNKLPRGKARSILSD